MLEDLGAGGAVAGASGGGGEGELAAVLQALAGPARVGAPAQPMSKHLRVLLAAGIVTDERGARDARVRVFRLRRESVVAVRAWLDQVQAHWDEQLRAFKAHVEREGRR